MKPLSLGIKRTSSNRSSVGHAALLVCFFAAFAVCSVAASEGQLTHIVPIWVSGHQGADGRWDSRTLVTNPHDHSVELRIDEVLPLLTTPCQLCPAPGPVTIPPHGSVVVTPGFAGGLVVAGAFRFTTTDSVVVDSRVFSTGLQRLSSADVPTLHPWLSGSSNVLFSDVLESTQGYRCNLFALTPEFREVHVAYQYKNGTRQYQLAIPPRSVTFQELPAPDCLGEPCAIPQPYPPTGVPLTVAGDGFFQTIVSCGSRTDSLVFTPIVLDL
jgi:hypothetical protein